MDLRTAGVTGMRRSGLDGDGGWTGGGFVGFAAVTVDELEVVDVIGTRKLPSTPHTASVTYGVLCSTAVTLRHRDITGTMDTDYEDMERLIDRLPETERARRLVKHLVIRDPNCGIKDEWVTPEMSFCRQLESVVLSGVPDASDKTIVRLARDNPNLQGLDLRGCKYVSDVGILELVSQAPPLQWLQLSGVVLTDPTVSAIAKTFSKLVELELCDEPLLSAVSVRDIWTYSRKLRVLRLGRCPLLTDKALPSPIKKGAKPVTGNDKPLPHRPSTWLDGLPPLILRHTAVDLRVLDLSYCTKLTDEGIEGVLVHAPSLHTLSLAGCTNLTDRSVDGICKLGVQLGAVTLAHVWQVTDAGIVKLARTCVGLKSVDVACRPWFSLRGCALTRASLSTADGSVRV